MRELEKMTFFFWTNHIFFNTLLVDNNEFGPKMSHSTGLGGLSCFGEFCRQDMRCKFGEEAPFPPQKQKKTSLGPHKKDSQTQFRKRTKRIVNTARKSLILNLHSFTQETKATTDEKKNFASNSRSVRLSVDV